MSPRPLYLHIGASKTGTSALQRGIFDSVDELARQGIGVPLTDRQEHVRRLLRPLGWVTASGFVRDVHPERLDTLRPRLKKASGERLLVTCEDLCEADTERIRALVDLAEGAGQEVRVVLTARGLASVIPSEWQQFLKHRMTLDYPTFLGRLRDRRGRWAQHFWLRQDVAEICGRWGDVVGRDRLDVVVTPDRATDPDGLYRIFGQVVGFDPAGLQWPGRNVNASWGHVEAEVYRRVNEALGDRLERYEQDYQPGLRWPLVQGVLPRTASARIPLPPAELDWVAEAAEQQVGRLEDSGVRVHGDLKALLPTVADTEELPAPDEAEVAQAAVDTLANFAVFTHRRRHRGTSHPVPAPTRPRRLLAVVRRRLRR